MTSPLVRAMFGDSDPVKRQKNTLGAGARRWIGVLGFSRLLTPFVPRVAVMMAARAASAALSIYIPLVMRNLIDSSAAWSRAKWPAFLGSVVRMFEILLVLFALSLMVTYLSTQIEQLMEVRLTRQIQSKWRRMIVTRVQRWGIGEHIVRASSDVDNVCTTLLSVIPGIIQGVLQFAAFAIVVHHLASRLFTLYIVSLPPLLGASIIYSRKCSPIQHGLQSTSSRINDVVSEYIRGILTIKLFRRERFFGHVFVRLQNDRVRLRMRKWRIDTLYQACRWGSSTLWGWFIFAYGLSLAMRGQLSLGTVVAVQWYLNYLTGSIDEFSSLVTKFVVGSVSAQRLSELFSAPEEVEKREVHTCTETVPTGATPAKIDFQGSSFGYSCDRQVIRGLTATIHPGEMVGLTGPSGIGKTTLSLLLARLYEVDGGDILLNDISVRHYDLGSLRNQISVATQNPFFMFGSIRDNIVFGYGSVSDEELVQAAKVADAHQFISDLEDGYDTPVSELLPVLSLGQKQRVGLARALLKRSSLLVCDECLTGVELERRRRVMQSLRALRSTRTIIMISHDPCILSTCDRVLVLAPDGSYHISLPRDVLSTVVQATSGLSAECGVDNYYAEHK